MTIIVTRRRPDGTPLAWLDTVARIAYDETPGAVPERPFTAEENARVDGLTGTETANAAETELRTQLAQGITALEAARQAARDDVVTAGDLRTAALSTHEAAVTQRQGVAAFVPSTTYKQAELAAVRDQLVAILNRQALIIDALAGMYAHRVAVDENAVTNANSLLWLARLAGGVLNDQNGGN